MNIINDTPQFNDHEMSASQVQDIAAEIAGGLDKQGVDTLEVQLNFVDSIFRIGLDIEQAMTDMTADREPLTADEHEVRVRLRHALRQQGISFQE